MKGPPIGRPFHLAQACRNKGGYFGIVKFCGQPHRFGLLSCGGHHRCKKPTQDMRPLNWIGQAFQLRDRDRGPLNVTYADLGFAKTIQHLGLFFGWEEGNKGLAAGRILHECGVEGLDQYNTAMPMFDSRQKVMGGGHVAHHHRGGDPCL